MSFTSSLRWAFFVSMDQDKEISGAEAIQRIRNLKLLPGATFGIRFITCDLNRDKHGEIRIYSNCQIRPAMRSETLKVDPDHYLFFKDIENKENRQCFKILLRAVCLPPDHIWYKVNWFQ